MKLFAFMGASGSGKSVIQHSLPIDFMTNYTTRPLRDGEIDGYHINHVSKEEFLRLDGQGFFLETTNYSGNLYGTPRHSIDEMFKGKFYHCTKDLNGVKALEAKLGNRLVTIYIKPPNIDTLAKRMLERGDDAADIIRRIKYLQETNELENEKYADYVIVNDDLMEAQLEAHRIVIKEMIDCCNGK